MDDPFVQDYEPSELEIAAEFLTNWLPFLTRDLCDGCSAALRRRIQSLHPGDAAVSGGREDLGASSSPGPPEPSDWSDRIRPMTWDSEPPPESAKVRMSWADMAQEDELEEEEEEARRRSLEAGAGEEEGEVERGKGEEKKKPELSREQRELIRFRNVGRKKDFICLERVKGKIANILDGLELHTGVFSAAEQKRIVDFIYELQEKGRNHQLGEHTYSEPRKWMPGKGRATIQFGCCYNFSMDKDANLPGILQNVIADPIPHLFKVIIRRLIRWHVLPAACIPDSCIVNIYEPGDCIPPHIDSHDFARPFCTVSFLSECNILFGSNLKVAGAGESSVPISLPVGSVLVLNGNVADVAKALCASSPKKKDIHYLQKMDENKRPVGFKPEPDLQSIQPLPYDSEAKKLPHQDWNKQPAVESKSFKKGKKPKGRSAGIKPEQHLYESQSHPYDASMSTKRSAFRAMDDQRAMASNASERGRTLLGGQLNQSQNQICKTSNYIKMMLMISQKGQCNEVGMRKSMITWRVARIMVGGECEWSRGGSL
ncbi:RNA demethylase ALKBH9B-like [Phoenix dactylifera]|uniref:RNA demethylase ALKBH9B-like n=1 Tax=Phoenix dactylifera TaxID=42345 RepID=A0A8B7C239_PHODC|nr:RNA demethylase ALKBH9B-like [Phoenix dactylifera]